MKKTAQRMPRQEVYLTTLLISLSCFSFGLQAQNIYKCGSNYSQTPCPGASTLNLDDPRDAAQKRQSDAATRRDTGLAAALEKDRVAHEKMTRTRAPATEQVTANAITPGDDGVIHKITPKRIGSKHHKPKAFIAEVPGSEKKSSGKKFSKKKIAAPA